MPDLMLSVVVPCRNRARYLRATIDSILTQQGPPIECIVVDACSTDGTVDILHSYGQRIRWVSEPDAGHADAINKGWRMARGDVLAWLNADDVYAPGGPGEALAYLAAHDEVDVVYGDCGAIDDDPDAIRQFGYSYLRPWDLDYAVLHCDNCIPQPSAFIRRRILDRVGMLDTTFHQKKDHELWLRIAARGGIIRHVPRLWAHARAIRGLSFDGRTAAPACPQLTRHYFTNLKGYEYISSDRNKCTHTLFGGRGRAMSNAHVRGMAYAWAGGRLRGLCGRYAAAAVLWDATNWRAVWGQVRRTVLGGGGGGGGGAGGGARGDAKPQAAGDVEVAWLMGQLQRGGNSGGETHDEAGAEVRGEAMVLEPRDTVLGLAAAMMGWRTLVVAPRHEPWTYHHPRLRFLRDSPTTLAMPEGSFDLIVARDVPDPAAVARWLKPGGVVHWTGPSRGTIAWRIGHDGRWVPSDPGRGQRFGGTLVREHGT